MNRANAKKARAMSTLQTLWIDKKGNLTAKEEDGYSMPLYSAVDVDAMLKPMTWTANKPKVPGWYWWRYSKKNKQTIFYISQKHIQKYDVFTVGTFVLFLEDIPGQWSGPLNPPEG